MERQISPRQPCRRYDEAMTQKFDAIFAQGVFRPLVPVDLPENARVHIHLQASPEPPIDESPEAIARQQASIKSFIEWLDNQPREPRNEQVSAADHDAILYGWRK